VAEVAVAAGRVVDGAPLLQNRSLVVTSAAASNPNSALDGGTTNDRISAPFGGGTLIAWRRAMALGRCENCGKPAGRTRNYVRSVKPVGYPATAATCGCSGCKAPALVWLESDEDAQYARGQRVFTLPTQAMKVRVE
jgi:hypothetical protein